MADAATEKGAWPIEDAPGVPATLVRRTRRLALENWGVVVEGKREAMAAMARAELGLKVDELFGPLTSRLGIDRGRLKTLGDELAELSSRPVADAGPAGPTVIEIFGGRRSEHRSLTCRHAACVLAVATLVGAIAASVGVSMTWPRVIALALAAVIVLLAPWPVRTWMANAGRAIRIGWLNHHARALKTRIAKHEALRLAGQEWRDSRAIYLDAVYDTEFLRGRQVALVQRTAHRQTGDDDEAHE